MDLIEKRLFSGFPTIHHQALDQIKQIDFAKLVPHLHLTHIQQLVIKLTKSGIYSKDVVVRELISLEMVELVALLDLEQLRVFVPKQIGRVLASIELHSFVPSSLIEILIQKSRSQTISWIQRIVPLREPMTPFVTELQNQCLIERVVMGNWEQMESIQVLDSCLGTGGVDIDVFGHVVLQRLVVQWVQLQYLDFSLLCILDRLTESTLSELLLRTIIVACSTILLDRDERIVWKIAEKAIENVPGSLIGRVLLLPCLQTLMIDSKRQDVALVLQKVEAIEDDSQPAIDYELIVDPTYGVFVQLASSALISSFEILSALHSIPALKSIVFASQCLLPEKQVYDTLYFFHQNILLFRKQDMLTILLLFMYLAKQKMEYYIVTVCVPQLTLWNDAFVTAAVVQFVLQLCEPRKKVTVLERVGIEALLQVYKSQKRVWSHLKNTLFRWADRYKKSDRGRVKDDVEIEMEDEIQVFVCEVVLELCNDQGCARDLLPLIVSLLKPQRMDRVVTLGLEFLLDAFLECIEVGVTTPQAAWTVAFKSYTEQHMEPTVLIRLCKYIGIVAKSTFDDVEKEVEFRNQMLALLVPLLEHEDPGVNEAGYAALLDFPFEDVQASIPPPSELFKKGIFSDFLIKKIQIECREMSRPVFKGIATEEGGKKSTQQDKHHHDKLKAIENQIGHLWQGKPALYSHAALFCIDSKSWKEDFEKLLQMSLQDSNCPFALEGYTTFWAKVLRSREDHVWINEPFDYIVQKLNSTVTPVVSMNLILGATGLVLASLASNLSTKWTHEWMEFCRQKLEQKNARDVEGCYILCLSKIMKSRKTVDIDLVTFVWNVCNRSNGFLHAFCGSLLIEMVPRETGEFWIEEYLSRYYDDGWKAVGAAIGFSVLLSEEESFRDAVSPQLSNIIQRSFQILDEQNKMEDEFGACWVLSCLADENATSILLQRLEKAIKKREEDLLPHLFMGYLRCAPQSKYSEVKELIDWCVGHLGSEHNAIKVASLYGMQVLVGNDCYFSHSVGVSNLSDSLQLIEAGLDFLVSSDQSRITRTAGFFVGSGIARIQSRMFGFAETKGNGDPIDYRRLNPEKSYLRACFDLLKKPNDDMDWLILKNILFNVDCILPPVDWSFLLESRTKEESLEYFQFACKQMDSKSAKCLVSYFLELFIINMNLYTKARLEHYEAVLLEGLEKLCDIVGLYGGSLISIQQFWAVLAPLLHSALEIKSNDFGIQFSSRLKKVLQQADDTDVKHEISIKLITFIQQLGEHISSNAAGLCIKNLAAALATSPAEQDHFVHHAQENERDLWAYSAIIESRPEYTHQFLVHYYNLIKFESRSAVYCLWYVSKSNLNILKWFVDILDILIMTLNPDKMYYSKFLWNVGVSCLDTVTIPTERCDWKSINFNTILIIKDQLHQDTKSKVYQAIVSRLNNLCQHFQNNQIAREIRFLLDK